MSYTARYTYRLRPSKTAAAQMVEQFDATRWVWNRCVELSQKRHRAGLSTGAAELDRCLTKWRARHQWLAAQPSVPQQQQIRDFSTARAKCLKDRSAKMGRSSRGFPRFKSRHHAQPSMNYTRRGFSFVETDGRTRLRLAGGVTVPVVWSRGLPSHPSSVRVARDACGHWWASFVVEADTEPLPATGNDVGIDWGVSRTATATTDGHDLDHPHLGEKSKVKLGRYQKMMARRRPKPGKPASKGYRQAKKKAAETHRKVAAQRADSRRKWAKNLVRSHDRLAVEDFHPKFLQSTTMARSASDAAIANVGATLAHMAHKHERTLVLVPAPYTTMDCSQCAARAKQRLDLSCRTFVCATCGLTMDRDKNAAHNMVVRAGFIPAGADGVRPGLGRAS